MKINSSRNKLDYKKYNAIRQRGCLVNSYTNNFKVQYVRLQGPENDGTSAFTEWIKLFYIPLYLTYKCARNNHYIQCRSPTDTAQHDLLTWHKSNAFLRSLSKTSSKCITPLLQKIRSRIYSLYWKRISSSVVFQNAPQGKWLNKSFGLMNGRH